MPPERPRIGLRVGMGSTFVCPGLICRRGSDFHRNDLSRSGLRASLVAWPLGPIVKSSAGRALVDPSGTSTRSPEPASRAHVPVVLKARLRSNRNCNAQVSSAQGSFLIDSGCAAGPGIIAIGAGTLRILAGGSELVASAGCLASASLGWPRSISRKRTHRLASSTLRHYI